jgi:hypothetical protein
MNEPSAQLDPARATVVSPGVDVRFGFFFFTADNRRVLT